MYNNDDDKELDKLGYGAYEEEIDDDNNDDGDDEDSSDNDGQASPLDGGKGTLFKGVSNFLGNAGKSIKKVAKVINKLPTPVKAFILAILVGIVTYLIMEVLKEDSSDKTSTSVNRTIYQMQSQVNSGTIKNADGTETELTAEQKEKLQNAISFFEENNSYLYFTISNINDAYSNFVDEYKTSTNDVGSKLYKSYTTEYGSEELTGEALTQRIVNPNQKVPLYVHLLMTEKYNFNAVEWKWYGHGHDGSDLTDSDMVIDKELGIKYPNDGRTELDTFIDLLSPYMLTWHIPLGFHSGFLTKSGSDKQASSFTYSIVKDAYSQIVAHRYDIQKRVIETKFNEYVESVYKSNVDVNINVTYEYRPLTTGEKKIELSGPIETSSIANAAANAAFQQALIANGYNKLYLYTGNYNPNGVNSMGEQYNYNNAKKYVESIGGIFLTSESDLNISVIAKLNADEKYVYFSSNPAQSFKDVTESGQYSASQITYTTANVDSYTNLVKVTLNKKYYTYDVEVTPSGELVKDSNGNILYDVYVKYEYGERTVNEPYTVSSKDVNERLVDGNVDPMKEDVISDTTSVKTKYYIKEANTFDVKIANEFNYIKYSESDANSRKNAKLEQEYKLEDYEEIIDEQNKITDTNVFNYINSRTSLAAIENTFDVINCEYNKYNSIKSNTPSKAVKTQSSVTLPMSLMENGDKSIEYTNTYTISYRNKNSYTEKIGKSADGKGTHYIRRTWEDSLTQRSSKTTTYTEEDIIDFNANYNSNLNGTTVAEEKSNYEGLVAKSQSSYSKYKSLAATKMLSTIDMVNSNSNIYNTYLFSNSPQSKIMGYNRAYIQFALDEVKRLFKETENEKGTIPYVYGVSLGFTNILTESNTRKTNTSSKLFIWPIPEYEYVSYIFGYSNAYSGGSYTNPGEYGLHGGIDLSIQGAEVLAAAKGVVIASRNDLPDGTYEANSYGNYVKIDHGNGYATIYAHLAQDVKFTTGDTVNQGDLVGITDTTGSSSGYHLHYGIYQDLNGDGNFTEDELIDPLEFYVVEPANGNTIEYDELLLNPALGEQITMQDPYKFVGYTASATTDEEFVSMLHSWEGGESGMKEIDGVMCYQIENVVGNPTVGHGVDLKTSGYLDRFIAAGYLEPIKEGEDWSKYFGLYVPVDFVDSIEQEQIEAKEEAIRSKLAGVELTDYQMQAMVSRAYNCGVYGATRERPDENGLTFIEAYNKYWVGNETTEVDFEHPFFVNYMSRPDTSNGEQLLGLQRRRRAEWILFVTGTPANNGDERIGI